MTFAKLTSAFFVHVLNWIFFQILLKDRQATERKRELKVCSEKNNKPWYHRVHHLARCIPYHVCCYNSEPYLSIVLFIKKKTQSSHSCQIVPSHKADHSCSHINWIPVRQRDFGSTKNSITISRIRSLSPEPECICLCGFS